MSMPTVTVLEVAAVELVDMPGEKVTDTVTCRMPEKEVAPELSVADAVRV